MNRHRFDLRWRYWFATAVSLGFGVAGWRVGTAAAVGLTFAQIAHFAWREQDTRSLTMQVRWLYLAGLLLGLWPPLAGVHVFALCGVWVNVLYGYCLGARILSLLPRNRREPLSAGLVLWTFMAPPMPGSILDHARPPAAAARMRGGNARAVAQRRATRC